VPRVIEDLDDRVRRQSVPLRGAGARRFDESIDLDRRPVIRLDVAATDHTAYRRGEPKLPPTGLDSVRRGLARPRLTLAAGALILAVSFVIAMLLTKPEKPRTGAIKTLEASTVSDLTTLMTAVKAAGLSGSPDMRGGIDELTRIDRDQAMLRGWAVEIGDSTQPLTVMAFVDGRNRLTTETSGKRSQAIASLGLSDTLAAKVSFEGRLRCSKGQKLIVVAVAHSDVYGHFGSRLCP
jgi:hypothetical protein